jgi:hypothetical protein
MRIVSTLSAVALATLVSAGAAEAKGCIKGAIIGGLAGRYLANRKARREREIDYGSRVQQRGGGYAQRGYNY